MKIFTNIQTSSVAGISRVMSSFAAHVRSRGSDVELVCATLDPSGNEKKEKAWRSTLDEQHKAITHVYEGELPSLGDVMAASHTVEDVRRGMRHLIEVFVEKLREEKPDVVLLNGTYFVPWCLKNAAQLLRLPLILYYHGSLTKETSHWQNEKNRRLMHGIEASFDRWDMRYIFPSKLIKSLVEKEIFQHHLGPRRAIVLPNPIPQEFFTARRYAKKQNVGFVGRWTHIKNTSFIKRLVDMNHREGGPLNMHLVTDTLSRSRAGKLLHDRVRYARPFEHSADLADFYAKMKAVICPSHFETYGNVAQEAVAAGTPAFVSRHMGVAEVFEKIGLGKCVLDFRSPRRVFNALQNEELDVISNMTRRALREEAGADIVHEKLLQYIRA